MTTQSADSRGEHTGGRWNNVQQTMLMASSVLITTAGLRSLWLTTTEATMPWIGASVGLQMVAGLFAAFGPELRTHWSMSFTVASFATATAAAWIAMGGIESASAATVSLIIGFAGWEAMKKLQPLAHEVNGQDRAEARTATQRSAREPDRW